MSLALREFALEIPMGRIAGLRGGRGTGLPVLALHGWLDNAASFVPLAAHLDGIELVAPDLPGHGRSAHLPRGADYSFAGAVASVLDIADALGWTRFALLGHSMGAGIGSLVAAACPQRVAGCSQRPAPKRDWNASVHASGANPSASAIAAALASHCRG